MNLSGRYGASIGRSLGCSELHRCERPFRARPAGVIIIERQQRRINWHEARNVCSPRMDGCYRESLVIKAKEYKLWRLWAALLARVQCYELYDWRNTFRYSTALPPVRSFSQKAFNELHSWYRRVITIEPFTYQFVIGKMRYVLFIDNVILIGITNKNNLKKKRNFRGAKKSYVGWKKFYTRIVHSEKKMNLDMHFDIYNRFYCRKV